MIPAALANLIYSDRASFGAVAALSVPMSQSNVISVDFTAKAARRDAVPPHSLVEEPEWLTVTRTRLSALHRLADGWDGNGSLAVADAALAKADRILGFAFEGATFTAPPAAVPCADGSLQLEWWLTDTRFELSIELDGQTEGWAQDRISGHEANADGTAAIELLSKWSSRLTADKLAPQA